MVHAYNPCIWEAETGGSQVQGQPPQLSETLFQNKKIRPGVVARACNPSTWEAETGGFGFAASLSYLVRPSAT